MYFQNIWYILTLSSRLSAFQFFQYFDFTMGGTATPRSTIRIFFRPAAVLHYGSKTSHLFTSLYNIRNNPIAFNQHCKCPLQYMCQILLYFFTKIVQLKYRCVNSERTFGKLLFTSFVTRFHIHFSCKIQGHPLRQDSSSFFFFLHRSCTCD